jgi:hypothetical protein
VVARLDVGLDTRGREFLQEDASFGLQADINDGEFIGEPDDPAGDDGPVKASVPAKGFVEKRSEIFAHEMVLHGLGGPGGGGYCHVVD